MQDAHSSPNMDYFSLLDPSTLADDPALLKHLLACLLQMLAKETRRREEVERHIDALLKRMSRSTSVTSSSLQQLLFDLHADLAETPSDADPNADAAGNPSRKCRPHGRRKPVADVEFEEVIHDLPDSVKQQFPAGMLLPLPDVVTYQFDYRPGKIVQLRHIQKKYITMTHDWQSRDSEILEQVPADKVDCGVATTSEAAPLATPTESDVEGSLAQVNAATNPEANDLATETALLDASTPCEESTPIPGGSRETAESTSVRPPRRILLAPKQQAMSSCLAAPGLLALIWLNKFADHLPLYRQEVITRRYGIHFARSTLCDWMLQLARELKPLYERMIAEVLRSRVIHTDDTTVQLQDPATKKLSTARFWNYVGDEEHLLTVFQFTLTHERTHPATFLRRYRGYLQADAYNGYDGIYLDSNGGIVEVGCWFHARKRFKAAIPLDVRAAVGVAYIKQVYDIERTLRERKSKEWAELSVDDRAARIAEVRTELTVPILQQFEHWLRATEKDVLPKDALGDAIRYTLNQWEALNRFTSCGLLDPDNNEAERGHRGIAIGRKNWQMVGSDRGGEAAATHFSFIASCKMNNIDPFTYLVDVLRRLPVTPADQLDMLLPNRWRPLA